MILQTDYIHFDNETKTKEIKIYLNSPKANSKKVNRSYLFHKDSMVLAEQQGVRSQTQYKQEFLGTLYTADRLYGTQVVRPESGFVLAVK